MFASYVTVACASAFVCAFLSVLSLFRHKQHSLRQKTLKQLWQGASTDLRLSGQSLSALLIRRLSAYDAIRTAAPSSSDSPQILTRLSQLGSVRFSQLLLRAGLGEMRASSAGALRVRYALYGAVCAGACGLVVGPLFACFALVVGFLFGWASLTWALKARIAERSFELEKHLSEAIEVMCLGLRAGLSFERSLELYCTNFPSQFGTELASARQMWRTGLLTREDALKNLAASYDSHILGRVVDSIVRSLRFGSPLSDSLEELAHEARRAHRVFVEEKVMKAPVKMMFPIGLLILPSMLLLVMGPVMLDLIAGF